MGTAAADRPIPSQEDVTGCLRVLAQLIERPDDPALAGIRGAVEQAHRAVKKHTKVTRRAARRTDDHALTAAATRHRAPLPSTDPPAPEPASRPPTGELHRAQRCYVCKNRFSEADADYHLLCPSCATENARRRAARTDLSGRRAIVTGGRVKIGFHTALKLLRDGAEVLITTRFPRDAARRFSAVADASLWINRLWIHGVDFLDLPAVQGFVGLVHRRWPDVNILINNAAQTIRRPPEFYRELDAFETAPQSPAELAVRITGTAGRRLVLTANAADTSTALAAWFPPGRLDETGEPLDTRPINSWTLHASDVSPAEWLEAHLVTAFVPFFLTARLKPLLTASPHADRYVVQVSAMEGSFGRQYKAPRHPHTNMAKAALKMLTRTVADEYADDGIYMTSVDTGWVTDERPYPSRLAHKAAGFRPPLDVIDGAARVYDPVLRGVRGERLFGVFLKDYRAVPW